MPGKYLNNSDCTVHSNGIVSSKKWRLLMLLIFMEHILDTIYLYSSKQTREDHIVMNLNINKRIIHLTIIAIPLS